VGFDLAKVVDRDTLPALQRGRDLEHGELGVSLVGKRCHNVQETLNTGWADNRQRAGPQVGETEQNARKARYIVRRERSYNHAAQFHHLESVIHTKALRRITRIDQASRLYHYALAHPLDRVQKRMARRV
jgi:hypothetical protein